MKKLTLDMLRKFVAEEIQKEFVTEDEGRIRLTRSPTGHVRHKLKFNQLPNDLKSVGYGSDVKWVHFEAFDTRPGHACYFFLEFRHPGISPNAIERVANWNKSHTSYIEHASIYGDPFGISISYDVKNVPDDLIKGQ